MFLRRKCAKTAISPQAGQCNADAATEQSRSADSARIHIMSYENGIDAPVRKSGLSVLIEFLRIFQMEFIGVEFVYGDGNRFATV